LKIKDPGNVHFQDEESGMEKNFDSKAHLEKLHNKFLWKRCHLLPTKSRHPTCKKFGFMLLEDGQENERIIYTV
jgi:hypothetical protein